MKQLNTKFFIIIISLLFFFMLLSTFLEGKNNNLQKENTLYKVILNAQARASDVYSIEQQASEYYTSASLNYENSDYKGVIRNCELARGYYSQASQGYLDVRAELILLESEDTLIERQIEMLKISSELKLNMYEACEHFESASRYYDKYYLFSTPIDDPSFDMGGKEIDAMNEKINLHDENVRKYNKLLSLFNKELEKRLE